MQCDVAVVGAGPAGVQAAIHASRKKASVIVLGKASGSSVQGTRIDNYMGVGDVQGADLLAEGRKQAESTGAVFLEENVTGASSENGTFVLELEGGDRISAKAVVLATGISRLKLGIPGEKELFGKGVSYCAVCDCGFYRGKRVLVVGNDSEAAVSAEILTGFASETHWAFWDLKANESLVGKAEAAGVVFHGSRPKEIIGGSKVDSVTLEDGTSLDVDGVFIELGAKTAADIALDLDVMPEADDTIKVGADCSAGIPGLFACGDVTGRPWQVAKAVGEGCIAGTKAADYARGRK